MLPPLHGTETNEHLPNSYELPAPSHPLWLRSRTGNPRVFTVQDRIRPQAAYCGPTPPLPTKPVLRCNTVETYPTLQVTVRWTDGLGPHPFGARSETATPLEYTFPPHAQAPRLDGGYPCPHPHCRSGAARKGRRGHPRSRARLEPLWRTRTRLVDVSPVAGPMSRPNNWPKTKGFLLLAGRWSTRAQTKTSDQTVCVGIRLAPCPCTRNGNSGDRRRSKTVTPPNHDSGFVVATRLSFCTPLSGQEALVTALQPPEPVRLPPRIRALSSRGSELEAQEAALPLSREGACMGRRR